MIRNLHCEWQLLSVGYCTFIMPQYVVVFKFTFKYEKKKQNEFIYKKSARSTSLRLNSDLFFLSKNQSLFERSLI